MKKILVIGLLLCLVLCAFRRAEHVRFVVPEGWPRPGYSFKKNPLSRGKLLLGRALFYDPVLSRDSTISCASCHSQYAGFTHIDHALSHGIAGRVGTRNSPALMNLAWQTHYMWDGRVNLIVDQAVLPITHPDEMDETMEHVVMKLQRSGLYRRLVYNAYTDSTVKAWQVLESISQFMLSLVSADSRYDSVMRKQAAFTAKEENGYRIFRQHCSSCHTEPLFTNGAYAYNGLPADPELKDCGRMKISKVPGDSMRFKVPTLRNVEVSMPYMHDGRFKRLYDVVNHYTGGIAHTANLPPQLQQPIKLAPNDKVDLVAFLLTLTDKHFLFNSDYGYPKNIFLAKPNE